MNRYRAPRCGLASILAALALLGACAGGGGGQDLSVEPVDSGGAPELPDVEPRDMGSPDNELFDFLDVAEPEDVPPDLPAFADVRDTASDIPEDVPAVADVFDAGAEDVSPDIPPSIFQVCFPYIDDPTALGPVYDPLEPVIGSHCQGTNHQDIEGVEKVVFLGDSVTVGSPNLAHLLSIDNNHFYRNLLADWLADYFGLRQGILTWGLWKTYDYFTGRGGRLETGDFKNCSKWGARTDDLLHGHGQIPDCFPDGGGPYRTLVVFTMGGNDIAAITESGGQATPEEVQQGYPTEWALAESTVAHLEEAIVWLKDPERFPAGSFVVYNNGFEFSDASGQTDACTPRLVFDIPDIGEIDLSQLGINTAALAGINEWEQPEVQAEIVIWLLEEYMRIAVQYQVDMVWSLEAFCGHGYVATGPDADVENQCYQGPDAELYFDVTCIHPSDAGHRAMYEMFRAVIEE